MIIDTKSRKALAAILDIANHGVNGPVSLLEVSRRQKISVSYLEQIIRRLKEKGIVHSFRGPGGGYRLCRELGAISVADIVAALDKKSHAPRNAKPDQGNAYLAQELWHGFNDRVLDYLRSISLESLLLRE